MKNIEKHADEQKDKLMKIKFILESFKFLKPKLYKKMLLTGRLFENLITDFEEDIKIDKTLYVNAAYLCNIGFLAIEEFTNRENFHKGMELELIKKHVARSVEFLQNSGFKEEAEIVQLHHEYPNGMGYTRIQQQDRLIAYINIADEFIDLTVEYYKNFPLLTLGEALVLVLGRYSNSTLLLASEIEKIKKVLSKYYGSHIINV